jgi:hypothetical protein
MPYDHAHHCIFCSGNFCEELQPILGFATARACPACMEKFKAEIARGVSPPSLTDTWWWLGDVQASLRRLH